MNPGKRADAATLSRSAAGGTARHQSALSVGRHGPAGRVAVGYPPEQIVERPDRPTEQASGFVEQVALDPGDVCPVRHDQERFVLQARQIALEQERDLTRIRGPDDEI